MEVLLLSPAANSDRLKRHKNVMYAPLTLPMLASLVPEDCHVSAVDEKVDVIDFSQKPDLVGITAITGTVNRCYEVAQKFRDNGATVVMGGPHCSVMPDETLKYADSVVIGQAFKTWPDLIEDFRKGTLKEKYTDSNGSQHSFPIPRRELLKKSAYITPNSIQATLGCPNRCDFCIVYNVFGSHYVVRPISEIIEEIKQFQGKTMFFVDVNLTADPSYAKKLFKEMIPYKKLWAAQVTTGFTDDPEMLDLAAQAGCKGVFIGMESLNQASLTSSNKSFNNVERYKEMQRKLRDHDICSMLGIVYGFDTDDTSIFDVTMRFMDTIKADAVRYGIITPFPGTPFFLKMSKEKRIFDFNWDNYDSSHVVFTPKLMTADQLQNGFYRSMHHTYSWKSIIRRILGSRSYLPLSTAVNIGFHSETKRLYGQFRKTAKRIV